MAWNITRNEWSAETKRVVVERRRKGTDEQKFNAATRLAEEKQRQGEDAEMGRRLCDAAQTDWPSTKQQGAFRGASRSRAAQCGIQSEPESYIKK